MRGLRAIRNQFWNPVAHTAIAPGKGTRIVVVARVGVLEHMLEVRDRLAVGSGGNGGLVHMERARKPGGYLIKVEIGLGQKNGVVVLDESTNLSFVAADVGLTGS